MSEIVFDFGNARAKWFNPRSKLYGSFIHAIAPLSENEWVRVARRGSPPEGIAKINGKAFAFGSAARRHTIQERPRGAARYRDTYYGVAMAYALSESIQKTDANVRLCGSHAPMDIDYAVNLREAVFGQWEVESRHGYTAFNVRDVMTFDEPLGGYSHYVFTERGEERRVNPLGERYTLTIDVGGYTVDVVAVDPGGQIDIMSAHSTRTGVIDLMKGFEQELRGNNASLFQDTSDLDIRRVENALISGVYQFGRISLPCADEATAAINTLVYDVTQVINAAGGVANFDVMLLTGGGAALIYEALCAALPSGEFLMAEKERDLMMYANVFGGAKLSALLKRMGV